jgi:hypothetical protein
MPTEYSVTTSIPAMPTSNSQRNYGLACAASGIAGVAIGIVTLSYPAAVSSDQWSYPFDASAQWIVSVVLAITHLLTLAGFVGVIAAGVAGRSRPAARGLRTAIVGYAALAVCEVLSGAVGTRSNDSSFANVVSGSFAIASLLTAVGSIVAGLVITRRHGLRSVGWSMVLWSGVLTVVLVTPANIIGNTPFRMVALMLWSLTFVLLGRALARGTADLPTDPG